MLSIPVVNQWQWTVKTPWVYRYLPEEFVDDFFTNGRIRLTTFSEISKYPDEEKADAKEGDNVLYRRGEGTVMIRMKVGTNAYVLCGSSIFNDDIAKRFGGTAAIEIRDTTSFGISLGRRLVGLGAAMEGFCFYSDTALDSDDPNFDYNKLINSVEGQSISMDKIQELARSMTTPDMYFRKGLKYQHQKEYRIIWLVDRDVTEPLVVECPEARQFCAKRTLSADEITLRQRY